jgi:hypothetical protein
MANHTSSLLATLSPIRGYHHRSHCLFRILTLEEEPEDSDGV